MISLGLSPSNGVGIMGHNNPYWFISSLGAIFAGGLSCGIYTTNSASSIKYITQQVPLDLMVIQNEQMLSSLLKNEPGICDVVKKFILMEEHHKEPFNESENILTWKVLKYSNYVSSIDF